jgi:uncharacterized membrane protein YciS (DUF1049 family)
VIGLILVGLLALALVASLALAVVVVANEHWESRAEETRIDREVRRAEHQLHVLATQAFGAMLDVARSDPRDMGGNGQ